MSSLSIADVRGSKTENSSPPIDRASLRDFIVNFLKRCNIPYQGSEQPVEFEAFCMAEASARGYPLEDDAVLRRSIGVGATMAATSYSHLRDERVRIYIALFTGFVTYLDDLFLSHIDAIREFASRFVARQPQQLKILDDFAALLLEMPRFHNAVACNIILTSTLDYLSSLLIQYDVLGVPMPTSATEYPMFFRRLSGIGNGFSAFIFPASMPVHHWIYALPDIAYCVCTFNDIFSFYKEDLAGGEEGALMWLTARNREISAYESLCAIANETVDTHNRALRALAPFQDAYEAYSHVAIVI
ncbi:hypothetical protein A7U60_g4339 [Sanghuangporus baumii]|uniref:Trichodiene synthase n=1 Tax=Sanghuangporus baumii TaxID=108892 RepID=A0A9Q5HYW5_SANBA|nr:hypothetical protein A7U60_g4339 [Sanghuangporus baumii]